MKQKDLCDILFDRIKKISTPVLLILLMLIWQALGALFLRLFGINYDNLSNILKIIFSLICDISFLGILFFKYKDSLIKDFKNYFNKNILINLKLSFNYWIVGLIIMVISNLIIAIITNGTLASNEEAVRELIDKFPMYMAFQVMLYAPFTEEIIFRKSIKDATNSKYLFIFLSGFIFGGLHVISSITSLIDLVYLVPYCSLGFIFAMLYHKTGNIFSTITAHSFHNTLALLVYFIG